MIDQTNMHTSFKHFLQQFKNLFTDGVKRFEDFVAAYRLDVTKPYGDQVTRECMNGTCEAFQWVKPFIQYLKSDDTGKYYKVRALTATISANKNDYSKEESIEKSAPTLIYRPLNINHDRARWLPFPENRVDWAQYEDKAVECVIRIDNTQEVIQKQIESGDIVNPSIEARPMGGTRLADGTYVPDMWNFTGLALLEKDETIPGVPTTFGIEPLFMNEGMAERLVESVDWNADRVEIEEKEMNKMSEKEQTFSTHEPATEEELLEYWGNQSPSNCGYCKFFEMTQAVTTRTPAVTGADSDAFNTRSIGYGLGVGKCTVLEKLRGTDYLVKHSDWACGDGRPRDNPILVNRTSVNPASHESIEVKAVESALTKQIDELNEKLLDKDNLIDKEKREKAELRVEVTKLTEQLGHSKRESNSKETKVTTLTSDRVELRETLDKLKDTLEDTKLKLERTTDDVTYHQKNSERVKEQLTEEKEQHSLTKDALERIIGEKTDESLKRATAVQQAENDRDAKLKLLEENSLLMSKLAETQRSVTDYANNNSRLAREVLDLTNENSALKTAHFEIEETLKDTRRELNQAKKRPTNIRVMV